MDITPALKLEILKKVSERAKKNYQKYSQQDDDQKADTLLNQLKQA